MADINRIPVNLKFFRKQKSVTQRQLAQLLNISPQSVSKWERGTSIPDVENLCRIAEILDVSVDALLAESMAQRLLIGVDGGGTKTEFVLFSEQGYVLKRVIRGGCNPNTCGLETTLSVLKSGVDELLLSGKTAAAIFVGAAGFTTGNYASQISNALHRWYPNTKIHCDTDIRNVIGSAIRQEDCIAAICGTGSVVYVNRSGELARLGGWGYLLDQGGSGYDIGRDALTTALAQRDGIGAESHITQLVEARLGDTVWNKIHDIYQGGAACVASFAPMVFEAYQQGDAKAEEILMRNAARLAELINQAHEMNPAETTVVVAGSVISKSDIYLNLLKSMLHPELDVVVPERSQIFGACVQCCRLVGVSVDDLYANYKVEEE